MNYETALEAEVSKTEAIRELKAHGFTQADFEADEGPMQDEMKGSVILNWLGY